MLKQELFIIIKDLKEHHRNKKDLLEFYIQDRLDKSIKVYYDHLIKNYNTILNTYNNDIKMIKKLSKETQQ